MVETIRNTKKLAKKMNGDEGFEFHLKGVGVLRMERKLPFLLVYRYENETNRDKVIENMVKNEASYIVCQSQQFPRFREILKDVVKIMSDEFGAFLLLEIWPDENPVTLVNTAGFEIFGPSDFLENIVSPIKEYIENMNLAGLDPKAELTPSEKRCPENSEPLLDRDTIKQLECLMLGLKIEPFYKDNITKRVYPILTRRLYSSFSEVFKKAVFDFVSVQTNHNISGFQSLAKRRIQPEVWEIDEQLFKINNQIQFLMLVSPVNGKMAWNEFKKNKFKKCPVFHYRMMPFDPELLKRKLYNIQIEEIDDPTLGFLFREKRAEVDKMLTMLNERESKSFLYGSLQLYGPVSHKLLNTALEILETFPVTEERKLNKTEYYNAFEFAELARKELLRIKKQLPTINTEINFKKTIDNLMVEKGVLNIPENSKIPKNRAKALINHEVGTHVLTYYNGQSQPLKLLCSGIPGYEELQEGIAVLAEYLSGGLNVSRVQILAARVIAVDALINHNDFIKTFEMLTDGFHFKPKTAFFIANRVHRGGGLTKDAIYLRGLVNLVGYLKEGHSLEPLLVGKIRQNYLPVIDELIERKVLHPIRVKPEYLLEKEGRKRLSTIKKMNKITDLINLG